MTGSGDTVVVVDFGTAITYDAVSAEGEYLGGIITPGAEISLDALYERAARLPKVEFAEPRALIGKSTVEAVRSGMAFGYAGQVEGIVRRLRAELGETTTVIATGGLAPVLTPYMRDTIDPGRRVPDADRAAADLGAQRRVGAERDEVWTYTQRWARCASMKRLAEVGHRYVWRSGDRRGQQQVQHAAPVVGGRRGGGVVLVEQMADGREHRRVVDPARHVAALPRQRQRLAAVRRRGRSA